MPGGSKLSTKQEQFLAGLLSFPTIVEAATATGISERTAHSWLKRPGFAEAYRELRHRTVEQAMTRVQGICGKAVAVLEELLGTDQGGATRLGAARAILEHATHAVETTDLLERLERVEAILEGRNEHATSVKGSPVGENRAPAV